MIEGKIEAGIVERDKSYLLMPNSHKITTIALYGGETDEETFQAVEGEQVRIRLRGLEEEDIMPGSVLCSLSRPVHCVKVEAF